ncbi:CD276 antigen-like isoform X2 [Cheilinus undulatus]|uniref:CD276 antigen-like isoform X2 n=1 Tax=Cheilinus undulatus TaxID=241271 RepID=UPI001BD67686|nr:CD276 antigen-like isoform X2 [Cheilinus undulatus]
MLHDQRTMALLFLLSLLLIQTLISSAADVLKVEEDRDVVLPCSLSSKDENLESKLFGWKKDLNIEVFMYDSGHYYGHGFSGQDKQFEGRVSHFQDELKNGNASIKITKAKLADRGNYTCIFPRQSQSQTFHIQLLVECILKDRTAEKKPGACPEPYITLDETNNKAELQCKVRGVCNDLKIEWRNSSNHSLSATNTTHKREDGSYDIVLNATVTKSDTYRCVITQEDICHQVSSPLKVAINEPSTEPTKAVSHVGWIALGAFLAGVVAGIAGGIAFLAKHDFTKKSTKRQKEERPLKSSTDQVQNGSS